MSGVIKLEKAFDLFKTKLGEDYSKLDIYNEFILSNELDLFVHIDASVCECIQRGSENDSFYVNKVYPHTGYVRIPVDKQVHELFSDLKDFLQIEEITGIYKSNGNKPTTIKARLFPKELDHNSYNSIEYLEISHINSKESAQQLDLKLEHLFLSRAQISKLDLNSDLSINSNISDPYSESLETKLLQEIQKIDPKEKGISKGTLAKFLTYANEALK